MGGSSFNKASWMSWMSPPDDKGAPFYRRRLVGWLAAVWGASFVGVLGLTAATLLVLSGRPWEAVIPLALVPIAVWALRKLEV